MENKNFKYTLSLLNYLGADNFPVEFEESILSGNYTWESHTFSKQLSTLNIEQIINCYNYEKLKFQFTKNIGDEKVAKNLFIKNFTIAQSFIHQPYVKIKRQNYILSPDYLILTKCTHNWPGLRVVDFGGKVNWEEFLKPSNFMHDIAIKYIPLIDDSIELILEVWGNIIISMYQTPACIEDIIAALSMQEKIASKFSIVKIKKIVIEHTRLFLYWGIIQIA